MTYQIPIAIEYDSDDDTFILRFWVDDQECTLRINRTQTTELVELLSEALIAYPEDLQRPSG